MFRSSFHRSKVCLAGVSTLFLMAVSGAWGQVQQKPLTEQRLRAMTPLSPNPYLAYLPEGVEPDYAYWNAWMRIESQKRAAARATTPLNAAIGDVTESEPNNSAQTADFLSTLGLGGGQNEGIDITGNIGAPATPVAFTTAAEDNGSIDLASAVAGLTNGGGAVTTSTLGDGPHGSAGTGNGDYDFFIIPNVQAGDAITANIDTVDNGGTFDSFLSIWTSDGELLAFNDDENFSAGNFDSLLDFTAPAPGTYFVCVGAFASEFPIDPFDSSSGFGSTFEGPYTLTLLRNGTDVDFFSFDLQPGDVVGASGAFAATGLALFSPEGDLLIGSGQDASSIYPAASLLPGGGNAVLHYVAPSAGRYALRVSGGASAGYVTNVRLFRPPLDSAAPGVKQILFVDFDGASIDVSIFGAGASGTRNLSPLSSFLSRWGFAPSDESDLIDAILEVIEENLRADMLAAGNPFFDVDIRNSRDHADPFGQPNVSRLIVGGTIAESGISTIGIAESIDPGNFDTSESALTLLDLLSESASDPNSLNQYPLGGGATRLDVVATGVGNITAHEAGHFFGNFHTDNSFTPPNIMDQGGNLDNTVGVGDDGTFGNGDDIDNDFGPDFYIANEGFTGTEDTLSVVAFGLTTLALPGVNIFVDFSAPANGDGSLASPFNTLGAGVSAVTSGGTVHVFPGKTGELFVGPTRLRKVMTVVNAQSGAGIVKIGEP